MNQRSFLAILALLASPMTALAAQLELPLLFSDGAVLQRDRALPVWGQAAPGGKLPPDGFKDLAIFCFGRSRCIDG